MLRDVLLRALLCSCVIACSESSPGSVTNSGGSSGAASLPGGASGGGAGSSGASAGGAAQGGTTAAGGSGAGQGGAAGSAGGASGGGASHDCPRDESSDGALSPTWLAYANDPDAYSNVPNVSYAGYHHGESALPTLEGPVIDVKTHGAVGNGVSDDTAAVRAALAAVPATGGVVYFPDGTYVLSGVLFVHTSHTVLRGQSREGTKLLFNKPLDTSYATNTKTNAQSRWSWAGGMVWFTPASKNTYLPSIGNIGATFDEEWNVGAELTSVSAEEARGSRTVEVANGAAVTAGEYVFIQIDNTDDLSVVKHLTGDGAWAESYDWSSENSARVLSGVRPKVMWPVKVDAVDGNIVTLHQPLRFDLRTGFNAKVHAMGDTIRESGLEQLTVVLGRDYTWSFASHHNKEVGWNGPWFNNAVDCFMRAVTVVDSENGPGVAAAKNVTFSDFSLVASSGGLSTHHHATTMRVFSQDVLFEKFVIESQPFHGINVEGFSMGGVWSEGQMLHGTFDTHRNLPLDCVHTEITVNNDGTRGGAADAGPVMGARFVNWNIDVTGGSNHMIGDADIMPLGALVGVRGTNMDAPGSSGCIVESSGVTGAVPNPPNLYRASLALRLCGGI